MKDYDEHILAIVRIEPTESQNESHKPTEVNRGTGIAGRTGRKLREFISQI